MAKVGESSDELIVVLFGKQAQLKIATASVLPQSAGRAVASGDLAGGGFSAGNRGFPCPAPIYDPT